MPIIILDTTEQLQMVQAAREEQHLTKAEHDLAYINQSKPGKRNSDFSIVLLFCTSAMKKQITGRKWRSEEGRRGRSHERKEAILSQSLERKVDSVQKLLKQFFSCGANKHKRGIKYELSDHGQKERH